MRRLAAIVIVVAVVMAVLAVDYDRAVPMPVSNADANSDAADPDLDAFRDDHWFVAAVRRTGKCRHRQERNKKKRKQSILHDTLFGWGRSASDTRRMHAWYS